jgi:hypothetical protein
VILLSIRLNTLPPDGFGKGGSVGLLAITMPSKGAAEVEGKGRLRRLGSVVLLFGLLAAVLSAGVAAASLTQPQIQFLPPEVVVHDDGLRFLFGVEVTEQTAMDVTAHVQLEGPITVAGEDWIPSEDGVWSKGLGTLEEDSLTILELPTTFTGDGAGASVRVHLALAYERNGAPSTTDVAQYTYDYVVPSAGGEGALSPWTLALVSLFAAPLGLAAILRYRRGRPEIEEVFIMHDSGVLIARYGREAPERDSDIMGGMFLVVQEFVRDTFLDRAGVLDEIRFGGRRILMVRGRHTILAAVVRGNRANGLPRRLRRTLATFEGTFARQLAGWGGRVDDFRGADRIVGPLLAA